MSKGILAMYIRLSLEDLDVAKNHKDESNSVSNQRELILNYISKNPEFAQYDLKEFCDDGHSGTNFDRPAVKELLRQVKNGAIKCIVVKDFSRFGRNYLEVGDYLEQVFPFLGVRFVSINDVYDSIKNNGITAGIDVGLRNLINDMYSRDLSVKVMSAKLTRAKHGEYLAAYTPFGYVKSKEKKNSLVVDEEAAKIVRHIFELAVNGNSTLEITRILNADNVPTPSAHYRKHNDNNQYRRNIESKWYLQGVLKILTDQAYLGKTVSFKRKRIDVGSRQTRKVTPENWIVVDNTHEPIVSEEVFNTVQLGLKNKKEYEFKNSNRNRALFGKIKCGICKRAINFFGNKKKYFQCKTPQYDRGSKCFSGKIYESELEKILLSSIIVQAQIADRIDHNIALTKQNAYMELSSASQVIQKTEQQIKRLETLLIEAYESYVEKAICKEEYFKVKDELNQKVDSLSVQLDKFKADYELALLKGQENSNKFVEQFKNHKHIKSLSKELVDSLVDKIYIYDDCRIEIVWKYAEHYKKVMNLISD